MRHVITMLLFLNTCAAQAQELTSAAYEAALRSEREVLKRGVVARQPNEPDTAFLKRWFPASFTQGEPIRYAWRPNAYGPQLFFSHGERDELHALGEGTELFVLDHVGSGRYAVQRLLLEPIGDITNLAAFCFADVERDGQKELLALVYAEVQHVETHEDGEQLVGRLSEWQTQVFRYVGPRRAGRPVYQPDRTRRPYLNGLRTVAELRQALTKQQGKPFPTKAGK
jgi:hypothetical protein